LLTTLSKIWLSVGPFFHSFDHNSLVSRPFFARKVSNRSSHHALQNGQGAVSSIQVLVWSTVRSNLGQTWSTLVKLGQNSPSSGKCVPDHVLRVSQHGGPYSVQKRLGQTSVKLGQLRSNLVRFWEMCPGPCSEVIWCGGSLSDQAGLIRAVLFCVPTPEKIPWVKMGL
jgi:hypothetical protein